MALGNLITYATQDRTGIKILMRPTDLLHHHQSFHAIACNLKHRARIGAKCWLELLNRCFDILRIMILTPNDQDVF